MARVLLRQLLLLQGLHRLCWDCVRRGLARGECTDPLHHPSGAEGHNCSLLSLLLQAAFKFRDSSALVTFGALFREHFGNNKKYVIFFFPFLDLTQTCFLQNLTTKSGRWHLTWFGMKPSAPQVYRAGPGWVLWTGGTGITKQHGLHT